MPLFETIDAFRGNADGVIPQVRRKQRIKLYCEGLKAKAKQAVYALRELSKLENQTDSAVTTTDPNEPPIQERVEFYCDTFWALLYSCLDVLGQIANQAMRLGFDEKDVSFKKIANSICNNHGGSPEDTAFTNCKNSIAFKNLDKYRNCSTHRRQIYICTRTVTVQHSTGYQTITTGDDVTVERILCDNPLDITPRMNQNRLIPQYMESTMNSIFKHIENIIDTTTTVR